MAKKAHTTMTMTIVIVGSNSSGNNSQKKIAEKGNRKEKVFVVSRTLNSESCKRIQTIQTSGGNSFEEFQLCIL